MPFTFHAGLKAALRSVRTRPVRLPWPYTILDGDGIALPPGTEVAIELDVPRIELWGDVLEGISTACLEDRAKDIAPALARLMAANMDKRSRERGVAKALAAQGTALEDLARREHLPSRTPAMRRLATVSMADAGKLCTNGKEPAPITSVVVSGRLVPITVKETERRAAMRALAEAEGSAADDVLAATPIDEGESDDIPSLAPVELDAPSVSSVFQVNDELLLPSPVDFFYAPAVPAHVAIVRFLVWAASDHGRYEERLAEKKISSASGENGESPPLASKPRRKPRRSSERSKK